MGAKLDAFAVLAIAITVFAAVYHPTISKSIATLGGAYVGYVIA